MKRLVITYNALMTLTPNGRTMISLSEGHAPEETVNFCVTGVSDVVCCSQARKVTNADALRSLFLRTEKGGKVVPQPADVAKFLWDCFSQ